MRVVSDRAFYRMQREKMMETVMARATERAKERAMLAGSGRRSDSCSFEIVPALVT